ncbi:polyketide synthase [Nocardia terpenica]|uniref:beta-ketoacyl [acyl carrier protein] synthase domain-containing protein n=1 Tax=Nocardia terpenica TaxID=455432 RepID=UPI002FE31181
MTGPREPIAIVGIAGLYPEARSVDEYWNLLARPIDSPPSHASDGLAHIDIDLARFRVPPVQRRSMTRMQMLMLEAARLCLADAGHPERPLAVERTDVVVGTCFGLDRQYANALRVEGTRYARELEQAASIDSDERVRRMARRLSARFREALVGELGASPHDRVGEMGSTIPARIAAAFRLLGRTIALESADATSFVALQHAVNALRANASDAVLVVTGQRREGPFADDALAAKGLPATADGRFTMSEGVGALLLKRRSSALRDGDRIYASILECSVHHEPRPGVFRYSTLADERYRLARECHEAAAVAPEQVRYVEYAGPGIGAVTTAEFKGLGTLLGEAAPGSIALGSAGDRLGNTFANAGLASVAKTALVLHHGAVPPQLRAPIDVAETPFRLVRELESWPAAPDSGSRYAAVCGSALGGGLCYLLLEGHDSQEITGRKPSGGVSVRPRPARSEAVAIVGFGGAFAGSPDAKAYWHNIESGRDGLGPLPDAVLDRALYHAPDEITLTHSYCDVGAAVPVPEMPPASLRITPRRYGAMDPAQRLALSVADETLTRYGRLPALHGLDGTVVIGSTLSLSSERRLHVERSIPELEAVVAGLDTVAHLSVRERRRILDRVRRRYPAVREPMSSMDVDGCIASGVAAVVANEYEISAVPVAVEAACASTLAALDHAVDALRTGATDFALAGGVELACNPRDLVLCSALGLLSHTRITPFDAAADGFSPGDGCALFLLKRLSDARRDGDEIFGLIRGIGGSNDAKSLIAPDADGQVRAMRRAFAQVEFDPAAVDYLEAHGTGTRVGDRVEISATARVYGVPHRDRPLVIGSAKSFVGHTFAAAGGAGLLRALQAVRARTFPPNANLGTPNPDLPIRDIPAVLPTESTPWPARHGQPRRAGVSSFGTGGINYHLLLEEHHRDTTA